jgi:hypothetical protein
MGSVDAVRGRTPPVPETLRLVPVTYGAADRIAAAPVCGPDQSLDASFAHAWIKQ